ncbi:MAG: histidinol dehydrogenase [Cellvibrionales bacterium]|nr:histidinol dehydrogenase [Cellvibrionales bacterium]
MNIRQLDIKEADFAERLAQLLAWESVSDQDVAAAVNDIILAVRTRGDAALIDFSNRFDRRSVQSIAELQITAEQLRSSLEKISTAQRDALEQAAARIHSFHERQRAESWQYSEADGTVLGQRITPLDRVGIYVPGGKASYPSSVLMNAIPAKVAGVPEIIMVVPAPDNELSDMVLAAAAIAGVDCIFTVGGAQAIAALAFGTETVPKVDKIVGPGNIYVATAKRAVFGQVGLDMIAGPSEILIVCDGKTNPDWIAMDLFSQAEHDEQAQAILVSPDAAFLDAVQASCKKLLPTLERAAIVKTAMENRAAFILVENLDQAASLCNHIAPEHLELSMDSPENFSESVRHAGAIFMGRYTPEALGDYCAGPNHVLPTSGTARFSSPLGVYDFQKRSSIIHASRAGAESLGKIASVLARSEQLTAHARSAEYRIN